MLVFSTHRFRFISHREAISFKKADRENLRPLDWKNRKMQPQSATQVFPLRFERRGSTHSASTLGWSNFRACIFFFSAKYWQTALFTVANAARLSKEFWKRRKFIYHMNMGYAHVFIEQWRSYRENITFGASFNKIKLLVIGRLRCPSLITKYAF